MKATGIVRKIDSLGRLVLPKELRKTLNINESDFMEIFITDKDIVLRKHETSCVICGWEDDLKEIEDKHLCAKCIGKIKHKI